MIAPYPIDARAHRIVLASQSPRRRQLLAQLGFAFDVVPADVDETPLPGEDIDAMVRRLAAAKALAVRATEDMIVIGADTAVEIDGDTLGKPTDAGQAAGMLRRLSGRTHRVHTAVALARGGTIVRQDATVSAVTFAEMTDAAVDWYVATGEPLDKAGSYGMQGAGGAFVESVSGSVTGVLGLPLDVVLRLFHELLGGQPTDQVDSRPAQ